MVSPSPRLLLPALAVAALAGCSPARVPAPYAEDLFSTNTLERYEAFSAQPATWRIRGGVLAGEGEVFHGALIRRDVAIGDGWVETTSVKSDDGGLIVRFQDNENYYMLGFRDDDAPPPRGERNLQLYRRSGEGFEDLSLEDIDWPRGTRRTIRLAVEGATLRVYVDGRLRHEWRDPHAPLPPGRIGVRHHGEHGSWITTFDSFRWSQSDR